MRLFEIGIDSAFGQVLDSVMDEYYSYKESTGTHTVTMNRGGFVATRAGHTKATTRIACLEALRAKCGHIYALPAILG